MELKRQLNAAAKRCTPEIEISNSGVQIKALADRIDQLLDYAEEKVERRKETEKTGMPFALRVSEKRLDTINQNKKAQAKEEKQIMEDRQQKKAQPDVVEDADAG